MFMHAWLGSRKTIPSELYCQTLAPTLTVILIYHLEGRWLATPISLGLSWPLTKKRHLLGVETAIYFHHGVNISSTPAPQIFLSKERERGRGGGMQMMPWFRSRRGVGWSWAGAGNKAKGPFRIVGWVILLDNSWWFHVNKWTGWS